MRGELCLYAWFTVECLLFLCGAWCLCACFSTLFPPLLTLFARAGAGAPLHGDTAHTLARRHTAHTRARRHTAHTLARRHTAHALARRHTAHTLARRHTAHGDTLHRVGMRLRWRGQMATPPFSLTLSFCKEEGREEEEEGVEGRAWVAGLR
jgi:hypothetical protein